MRKGSSFLIVSTPGDMHALAVELALQIKGYDVQRWLTSDLAKNQYHSFSLGKALTWKTSLPFDPMRIKTIWFRRPVMPKPSLKLPKEEQIIAQRESSLFLRSLFPFLGDKAFWVNPADSFDKANNKIYQLKTAKKAGLMIPPTLISNDVNTVRRFIKSHKDVIYKTFFPASFDNAVFYTSQVTLSDLPPANLFKQTPGIFQLCIKKAYELRITMLGSYPIAVKITYKNKADTIDWRALADKDLHYQKYNLPTKLLEKLKFVMKKLGIVFGCFDVIVTPEKEYVFLEVNEQGQFLWMEQYNPDIKLLDPFVQFLIGGNKNFKYSSKKSLLLNKDIFENISFKEKVKSEIKGSKV